MTAEIQSRESDLSASRSAGFFTNCSECTALSETTALMSPTVIRCGMVETTAHLIRDHIVSGARLMAREKEIITELKKKGIDPIEAERTLAQISACLLVLEKQWLAIWKKGNQS